MFVDVLFTIFIEEQTYLNGEKGGGGKKGKKEKKIMVNVKSIVCNFLFYSQCPSVINMLVGIFELPKDRNVDTNAIFRIIQMELILTGASALKVH